MTDMPLNGAALVSQGGCSYADPGSIEYNLHVSQLFADKSLGVDR